MCACHRTPLLVSGRIEIAPEPSVFRFAEPVPIVGPGWETCFEFNIPGDSHEAGGIGAVLVDTQGVRHALTSVELDRRGESVVCHVGSLSAGAVTLEAVELSARTPMRLRAIRGRSF